ncbi:MAG: hypothetical protein HGA90_02150 [Alphaproteobacteria bacterium]|nr:hypothetical protein [Alphaproteobacteria bacterium]
MGSADAFFNDYVHAKTGMDAAPIYVVNAKDHSKKIREWLDEITDKGLELPGTKTPVKWCATPEEAMNHLIEKLLQAGERPQMQYQQNLKNLGLPKAVFPLPASHDRAHVPVQS